MLSNIPLADKVLLVKESTIRAEEGCFDWLGVWNAGTHVEHLTTCLDVGVITCYNRESQVENTPKFKVDDFLDCQPSSCPLHLKDVVGILSKIG